jgi:hypothetical protein
MASAPTESHKVFSVTRLLPAVMVGSLVAALSVTEIAGCVPTGFKQLHDEKRRDTDEPAPPSVESPTFSEHTSAPKRRNCRNW